MRTLRHWLHRPPIRMGSVDNSRIRTTAIRNAGFVSFFAEQGCLTARSHDHFDARLRRQRAVRLLALIGITALATWVVIESAQAISVF
ncbi:hypothetical protein MASR2M8_14310 [Opitutaceae bacterium]